MFKTLTDKQIRELWDKVKYLYDDLDTAMNHQNPVSLYKVSDELQLICQKLKHHFIGSGK